MCTTLGAAQSIAAMADCGSSLPEESSGGPMSVAFRIELEQETDGRWIAEVVELPGVLA
jgi:hypothetical protein